MLRAGVVGLVMAVAGCVPMAAPDVVLAEVPLLRDDGTSIGTVRVFQENTGVVLRVEAQGLPPGIHGVHVHAVGRCEAPKFTSAGPHWNPTSKQHGHQNPNGYHRGDLGNLGVGTDGALTAGLLVPGARLRTDGNGDGPVLIDADGAALVFHAGADDERTDPSGNSGDRIACAVL
jgi:superoxide dismutase, Cu-Zn family